MIVSTCSLLLRGTSAALRQEKPLIGLFRFAQPPLIKRPPGADDNSSVFDYFINMNNVFVDQAVKERPHRLREIRDRYKFGMTLLTLALIRHDLEQRKRERPSNGEDQERPQRQDIHDVVADVTSAIAPFLLPLVDSLSRITGDYEALSAIAGEAA